MQSRQIIVACPGGTRLNDRAKGVPAAQVAELFSKMRAGIA